MKKYIIIFCVIILTLVFCVLNISFAKYQKNLQSDLITIVSKQHSSVFATISIVADEENTYNVTVTNNNDYDVKYKIQEEKDEYNVTSDSMQDGYFIIPANSTHTVKITLSGKQDVVYENMQLDNLGQYYKNIVLVINEEKIYDADKLQIAAGLKVVLQKSAKNQIIKAAGEIKGYEEGFVFSGVSGVDEAGLCSIIDPVSGETIYFYRGNVTNNYFYFAGMTWRILRINSDGSLRLILDSLISNSSYANSNNPTENTIEKAIELIDWENSTPYEKLHSWYNTNIAPNYDQYVVTTNYVFDTANQLMISSANNTSCYYFRPYLRVGVDGNAYQPTFSYTDENLVQDKIGLITADEVLYAGGFWKSHNRSYFLYNSAISDWWTMSPSFWDNSTHYKAGMIVMGASGDMYDWPGNGNTLRASLGLRPVISIKADLELDGNGSAQTPYQYKD